VKENTMKTMFLAAAAGLLVLGGAAQAEPFVAGHAANDPREAAALARPHPEAKVGVKCIGA
jgi:hypothetical protein